MYDYRDTAGQGERRPVGNIKFLGAEVVLQDDSGLCVIRYPLVKGDHTAELAVDFVGVLNHLHDVHTDGRLHMDIKLGNMVFNHSNGSESRLIDFDYSGLAGRTFYPSRYNQNIADGERHKDAAAGRKGMKSHDDYAMMRAMQLFQPLKSALAGQWHEWSTRVGEGQLVEVAIELAERGHDFELGLEGDVEVDGPMGSPPELEGGSKKVRPNEKEEKA
jgi:serine/threonine protein kinase